MMKISFFGATGTVHHRRTRFWYMASLLLPMRSGAASAKNWAGAAQCRTIWRLRCSIEVARKPLGQAGLHDVNGQNPWW